MQSPLSVTQGIQRATGRQPHIPICNELNETFKPFMNISMRFSLFLLLYRCSESNKRYFFLPHSLTWLSK